MPDRLFPRIFSFQGGFQSDLPTQTRDLKYWLKAENILWEISGMAHKCGGASKINSSAVDSGADIVGMFDFWRAGTAGTFSQKFVIVTGTGKVLKEDMDGTYDDITGAASISANTVPVFCQARDLLTIFTSSNDTPLKWNQTGNVASLGGTPPVGRGMVFHVNRGWIWGVNANPSRLYYSSSTDIEDWSGGDTGSIDIDPEDGDRIVGAVSFKQVLIVFKGPNKGSIHQISGTSPTGTDGFARKVLVRGIPLQTHNSIVPVGDDVLFMSDRGIHSLTTTLQFGNFVQADLTRYLKNYWHHSLNLTQLQKVWGVDYTEANCVLWSAPSSGSTDNDTVFGLSYIKLQEEGWKPFTWTRGGLSAAIRISPTTKRRQLVFGTTDGFTAIQDTADRSIYGTTAYVMRLQSPEIIIGQADPSGRERGDIPVMLERFYLRAVATGDHNVLAYVTLGEEDPITYTFNQGGQGFELDSDSLDSETLDDAVTRVVYSTPKITGPTRGAKFDFQQGGLSQDANLLEFGVEYTPMAQDDRTELGV